MLSTALRCGKYFLNKKAHFQHSLSDQPIIKLPLTNKSTYDAVFILKLQLLQNNHFVFLIVLVRMNDEKNS